MIWKRAVTLEALNAMGDGNMVGLLDIRFERISDDTLEASMPVDERTHQPFGLLHGGASVVLAETLGSVAGYLCTEGEQRWSGWRSMPTTCARYAAVGCAVSVKRCTPAAVIKCGRSISSMSRRASAALRG